MGLGSISKIAGNATSGLGGMFGGGLGGLLGGLGGGLGKFLGKNKLPVSFDRSFSINGIDLFGSKEIPQGIKDFLKKKGIKDITGFVDSLPLDFLNKKNKSISHDDINSSEYNPSYNEDFFEYNDKGKKYYVSYSELLKIREKEIRDLLEKDQNLFTTEYEDVISINDLDKGTSRIPIEAIIDEHEAYCGWYITDNNIGSSSYGEELYIEEPITYNYLNTYDKGIKGNLETYIKHNNIKIIKKYYSPLIKMIKNSEFDGINLKLKKSFVSYDEQIKERQSNITMINYKYLTNYKWLADASANDFEPKTEKPGWGSFIQGNCFEFETNNGFSSAYKWLIKNAINYGFVRTIKDNTDIWVYKPEGFDEYNMFKFVSIQSDSWFGLQDTVQYTPYINDLGKSYTQVSTSHIMEVENYNEVNTEKVKTAAKEKLIKLIKHLPNYKSINFEFKINEKELYSKKYLICYYKTKEGV